MIKMSIDRVTFENDENSGYCEIIRSVDTGAAWLEICGNETQPEYPLVLSTHEEIDYFANRLHSLLDGKLIATGFIKD
jgi:hypothetical protein